MYTSTPSHRRRGHYQNHNTEAELDKRKEALNACRAIMACGLSPREYLEQLELAEGAMEDEDDLVGWISGRLLEYGVNEIESEVRSEAPDEELSEILRESTSRSRLITRVFNLVRDARNLLVNTEAYDFDPTVKSLEQSLLELCQKIWKYKKRMQVAESIAFRKERNGTLGRILSLLQEALQRKGEARDIRIPTAQAAGRAGHVKARAFAAPRRGNRKKSRNLDDKTLQLRTPDKPNAEGGLPHRGSTRLRASKPAARKKPDPD